ncbi:MAG: NCS1 family nucleobase:cation symporter-1 [Firmicutes bacterium]|nr:NCS1 family nucleobase:cation symporter-1 [Bacillota bacterium]
MSTYTQVEKNGLFELTDAARAELVSSKYYNEDLAPTSVSQRTWTTYNITMLWVGMAICIPSLSLASGLIGMGVSPWLSVLNVALGNLIILIPIQLNSQIGTKYGIPFPLFARLTFGTRGAQLPAILRAITACGWTSVQAWVGGGAVAAIIGCFAHNFADATWTVGLPSWGGIQTVAAGQFIGYIIFIAFIGWIAYNGMEQIKWIQNIGGPILIIVMIALLIWAASVAKDAGYGFWEVMAQPNDDALIEGSGGFAFIYLSGLMGNIAFWATMALNIPDFSRYARSQKDQFRGQLYGMPLPMAFCAFIGAYFAQATKLAYGQAMFDPTGVFYHIENKIIVFIAALGVVAATVTTCVAANVVAPANGFSNIAPKKISYKIGVIITICIAFFILQAWWIYGSGGAYFTWMNAYGTILAPIAAIFIADYFVCKQRRADIASLFKGEDGKYWYSNGINWAAIIAWVVAFIFPLLTYFGMQGAFWTFINSINYIWSFVLGFVVYIILMKTSLAGKSFVTEEEHEAFTDRA